jgi:hypothetical protein
MAAREVFSRVLISVSCSSCSSGMSTRVRMIVSHI